MNKFLEILEEMAEALVQEYKVQLDASGHNATGELANSVTFNIVVNDSSFEITFNLADYWIYVENGRGPGKFPPPDSILDWIHAKGIVPHEINNKLPTEDTLAFLIGRKIANEGTNGTHDFERAKDIILNEYIPKLEAALEEDYNDEVITMFMNSRFFI